MKYQTLLPALIAFSTPALAHGDSVVHVHNHEYALWAIGLGFVVVIALRHIRKRDW